jgi:hypothetical protein
VSSDPFGKLPFRGVDRSYPGEKDPTHQPPVIGHLALKILQKHVRRGEPLLMWRCASRREALSLSERCAAPATPAIRALALHSAASADPPSLHGTSVSCCSAPGNNLTCRAYLSGQFSTEYFMPTIRHQSEYVLIEMEKASDVDFITGRQALRSTGHLEYHPRKVRMASTLYRLDILSPARAPTASCAIYCIHTPSNLSCPPMPACMLELFSRAHLTSRVPLVADA